VNRYNFARFFAKVQPVPLTGCWIWRGSFGAGYPQISYWGRLHVGAHVVSYTEFVGAIPVGHEIDHLCFNTRCVNPAHLDAVTPKINVQRRWAALPYCRNGHLRTFDNTILVAKENGRTSRVCRECRAATWKRNSLRRSVARQEMHA